MSDDKKTEFSRQLQNARYNVVEHALIGFVEEIDGKVPSEEDILAQSLHAQFAMTPLSTYERDGRKFFRYFVWRGEHALALEFLNENDPLELTVARLPRENWPPALTAYVAQNGPKKGTQ